MLKILPVFMTVIPGMCAVMLYPNEFINGESSEYDSAYPIVITNLLPNGIKGIVIAAMLSALMSSLAAIYNSASAIMVNDIYKLFYPNNRNEKLLVNIGRIGSFLFIMISMLWLPIIVGSNSPIYVYVVSIGATFQMPLSVLFFCGHFSNRVNVFGAYCCLFIGFLIGLIRFISIYTLPKETCDQFIFCYANVLYFGLFSFVVSLMSMIFGSLLSAKPNKTNISGYTCWNRWTSVEKHDDILVTQETQIEMDSSSHLNNQTSDTTNVDQFDKIALITKANNKLEDEKSNKRYWIERFMLLTGDNTNNQWNIILHIMTFCSVTFTISMWIYFW